MSTRVLFYGRWDKTGGAGHHIYQPNGNWAPEYGLQSFRAACYLAPGKPSLRNRYGDWDDTPEAQPEHQWRVYHDIGWTFYGAWDRTADTRYGSSAVLCALGTHDEATMRRLFVEHFPHIAERVGIR